MVYNLFNYEIFLGKFHIIELKGQPKKINHPKLDKLIKSNNHKKRN